MSKNETSTLLDVYMSLLMAVNAAKISTYIYFSNLLHYEGAQWLTGMANTLARMLSTVKKANK
ncbi:hypothetical protein THOD04_250005 [Vibrio owensii]|nr:hypothetical protein THOD04_250005 [Vibrio owensii]